MAGGSERDSTSSTWRRFQRLSLLGRRSLFETSKVVKAKKPKKAVDPSLASIIAMVAKPFERFWAPMSSSFPPMAITSLSERKILALIDGFSGDESGMAALQRRSAARLCRVYPRATRVASSNANPLPLWRAGAQLVCLNMQTNDLPTQLHYALFELGGGGGYVLKPRELREVPEAKTLKQTSLVLKLRAGRAFRAAMGGIVDPTHQEEDAAVSAVQASWRGRQVRLKHKASFFQKRAAGGGRKREVGVSRGSSRSGSRLTTTSRSDAAARSADNAPAFHPARPAAEDETAPPKATPSFWPPTRPRVRRVSIRILGVYHLPSRREGRPKLIGGPHAAALAFIPELNGERSLPDAGAAASSPSVRLSVHAIGGFACVSKYLPPLEGVGTSASTPPAYFNGLNPCFNYLLHCLAAEPRETILKVTMTDGESEVAYETAVLGTLRPGYRCFQLRSLHGTRIRLCSVLVHISLGDEANTLGQSAELRKVVSQQEAVIADKERQILENARAIRRLEERAGGGRGSQDGRGAGLRGMDMPRAASGAPADERPVAERFKAAVRRVAGAVRMNNAAKPGYEAV